MRLHARVCARAAAHAQAGMEPCFALSGRTCLEYLNCVLERQGALNAVTRQLIGDEALINRVRQALINRVLQARRVWAGAAWTLAAFGAKVGEMFGVKAGCEAGCVSRDEGWRGQFCGCWHESVRKRFLPQVRVGPDWYCDVAGASALYSRESSRKFDNVHKDAHALNAHSRTRTYTRTRTRAHARDRAPRGCV
eukprot:3797358-Pleurochrysis_carterae.AAC.1